MHSGELKDHEVYAQDDSERLGMTLQMMFSHGL